MGKWEDTQEAYYGQEDEETGGRMRKCDRLGTCIRPDFPYCRGCSLNYEVERDIGGRNEDGGSQDGLIRCQHTDQDNGSGHQSDGR